MTNAQRYQFSTRNSIILTLHEMTTSITDLPILIKHIQNKHTVFTCANYDSFIRLPTWSDLKQGHFYCGRLRVNCHRHKEYFIPLVFSFWGCLRNQAINLPLRFGLVWFYDIVGYSMPNPLYTHIYKIYMIWFGWVLWHINHCRLFNDKSSLYTYIKYISFWFGWVLWYIKQCSLFNTKSPLYIHSKYIWVCLVLVLWHINHCKLFNAKSSLYIYTKYI